MDAFVRLDDSEFWDGGVMPAVKRAEGSILCSRRITAHDVNHDVGIDDNHGFFAERFWARFRRLLA